jgi:Hemerythrin HHE cation binding domain
MLRRDLERVERLAAEVSEGLDGAALEAELRELKTTGPLWRLKVNCLRYCRFVHAHHGAEDALLFPRLREVDPAADPIVDRLEADHRRVSDLLDAVEAAAARLTAQEGDGRAEVVLALGELHGHLLEHLDFEETGAGPFLRRLRSL